MAAKATVTTSLTTSEAIALADKIVAGASLTKKQIASILLTARIHNTIPVDLMGALLDAAEAEIIA